MKKKRNNKNNLYYSIKFDGWNKYKNGYNSITYIIIIL